MLVGQTTEICSPAFCITTGVERSFWPESGVCGGKHLLAEAWIVQPGGISTSSDALRTASGSKPPYFSLATGRTLLSRTQVWLKPIEQCGGTSVAPVFAW